MEVFALNLKVKEEGTATVESALKRLTSAANLSSLAIGTGLTAALYKLVKATSEAQAVQAQLANAVRVTAGEAGQSVEALNAHATALQRVTTFGDEAINKAQARLLSYTNIVGTAFPRATEVVLDYAAAFNTDLVQASEAVGKALNYPTQGLGLLSKQGFIFTDAQKALIKTLEDTGRIAEAQAIIFSELESVTKGAAAAARDTLGGALQALRNAFGDLFEVSREGSSGAIAALEGVTKLVISLNENIGRVIVAAKTLAVVLVAPFAAKAVAAIVAMIGKMRALLAAQAQTIAMAKLEATAATNTARALALKGATTAQLTAAQLRAAIASRNLTLQSSLLTRAMLAASGAGKAMWVAIGGPIGAVVLALGAATAAFNRWMGAIEQAAEARDEEVKKSPEHVAALELLARRRREAAAYDVNAGKSAQFLRDRVAALRIADTQLRTALGQNNLTLVQRNELAKQLDRVTADLGTTTAALTQQTNEATDAQNERIKSLVAFAQMQALSANHTAELRTHEQRLAAALMAGNLPLSQRVTLMKELQAVTDALASSEAMRTSGERIRADLDRQIANRRATRIGARGPEALQVEGREVSARGATITRRIEAKPPQIALPDPKPLFDAATIQAAELELTLRETFAESVGNGIGDGIAAGFERAFATGRIGDGFKALAGTMLSGLGSAMVQFGKASLMASTFMQKIQDSLAKFSPKAAIAASVAMIAAGGALRGVASAAFGGMGGGGGVAVTPTTQFGIPMSGTGPTQLIFGATSATTAAGMTPRQAVNVTLIGPNDPTAQRAMQELLRNANQRGTLG